MRPTDYFYAAIPSVAIALPIATILPDMAFLHGIEKLGIVGILAAGILFFVRERRCFIAKSGERLEGVEKRLHLLESQVSIGNEKIVQLLGAQLDALRDIREGQTENFSRMWQITLNKLESKSKRRKDTPTQPTT
jgi:hypothetical protein